MSWCAEAPANIALIKYMGKASPTTNLPLNASLSYTLPHLMTHVELEQTSEPTDRWEVLNKPHFIPHLFSEQSQQRFLKHVAFLKKYFNCNANFIVRSANNFPHGTGLASSASSFAALTRATIQACVSCTNTAVPSIQEQANLSRLGSGSSCRSFFEPWSLWENDTVHGIQLPYSKLIHHVILIHEDEKEISSSEAHKRVSVLTEYPARKQRAERNLAELLEAFKNKQWKEAYHICWREFQDMHALFSASNPPFSYITETTHRVLDQLQHMWDIQGDGPLITMDAGPNIHLLYRPDQAALAEAFKHQALLSHLHVL